MRRLHVRTSKGELIFHMADRPEYLFIHGLTRACGHLQAWMRGLPGVCFLALPGHEAPDLVSTDIPALATAIDEALAAAFPPSVTVVGESLAGLAALRLKASLVVAVDPPIRPTWVVSQSVANAKSYISPGYRALVEQDHRSVLDQIRSPGLLIAGTERLGEPREVPRMPSVVTDEDFELFARHPLMEAVRVPGGHILLDHARIAIRDAILCRRSAQAALGDHAISGGDVPRGHHDSDMGRPAEGVGSDARELRDGDTSPNT